MATTESSSDQAIVGPRYGHLGKVLFVDLTEQRHWVEAVDESVYRTYLGGYGLGAWLLWKHFPAGADPLAPEACFAICSGLLTGLKTPFSGRIQIAGKSPLTGTWADSNSGGSVCSHLRLAGYDAMVVRGYDALRDKDVRRLHDLGVQLTKTGCFSRGQFPCSIYFVTSGDGGRIVRPSLAKTVPELVGNCLPEDEQGDDGQKGEYLHEQALRFVSINARDGLRHISKPPEGLIGASLFHASRACHANV